MSKNKKLTDESAGPAGQAPDVDEIDLGAAMPAQPPAPKRGRGCPRSAPVPARPKTRKTRKDKGITKKPKTPYIDNNILIGNNDVIGIDDIDHSDKGDFRAAADLKSQITLKELKFITFYLSGENTIDKSMILAGYGDLHQDTRYHLARKITQKYESQVDDHRIIARALGAGEVFIIKTLYSLAKDSKSEKIRGENAMNLAKILGLTKEQIEGAGGVTIVFEGPGAPGAPVPGPGAPPLPSQGEIKVLPSSRKPMMITK